MATAKKAKPSAKSPAKPSKPAAKATAKPSATPKATQAPQESLGDRFDDVRRKLSPIYALTNPKKK